MGVTIAYGHSFRAIDRQADSHTERAITAGHQCEAVGGPGYGGGLPVVEAQALASARA